MAGPALRRSLFLRSLLIQGSWNYRDLLGTGIAWALLPALPRRDSGEGEAERVGRLAETFNAHPYLTPVALGALERIEREGADVERIRALRKALRSPLGGLGDALFWGGWRPLVLLGSLIAALLGAPPLAAVALFLVGYNLLHLRFRARGLRIGREGGFELARGIGSLQIPLLTERIRGGGVLLLGAVLGVLVRWAGGAHGMPSGWMLAGVGLFLAGFAGGDLLRRWAPGLLVFLVLLGGWL